MIRPAICLILIIAFGRVPIVQAQSDTSEAVVRAFRGRLDRTVARLRSDTFVFQFSATQPGGNANKWARTWCTVDSVSFDIQRTASLVSPLHAIVTGRTEMDRRIGSTRAEAVSFAFTRDTVLRGVYGPTYFKMEYDLQGGRWVLSSGSAMTTQSEQMRRLIGPDKPEWFSLWSSRLGREDDSYCMYYNIWAAL